MKFDDFDKKMRTYEESLDQLIPNDRYMVARLDGKNFTRLTKELMTLEKPFDIRFRAAIVASIDYLMNSYPIAYAYNESDEISLLFRKNSDLYKRKVRKYNSILAAETSVKFSQLLGQTAIFDCRMIPLPTLEDVEDYFIWRQTDCRRNAINAHCYYKLLSLSKTPRQADTELSKKTFEEKTALLLAHGIDVNKLDNWQICGTGVYWGTAEKEGFNPISKKKIIVNRPKITVNYNLPTGAEYKKMIGQFLEG